ncbi:hypothetical protein LC607_35045 [Nostoc sp. CHAB 5824]|nr:hypothetical protein [Nostoc sp. CHAB 5824]
MEHTAKTTKELILKEDCRFYRMAIRGDCLPHATLIVPSFWQTWSREESLICS